MINKSPLPGLAAAELALVLKPVFNFLTALQQPGANISTVLQGVAVLELEEAAQLPAIQAVGLGNVAAAIEAQLQAWQAAQVEPTPAPTPAPTPDPTPAPAPDSAA